MIKLENVSKFYKTENGVAVGVQKVNIEFRAGEFVALTGESGSGKSTLLNVLSGLDGYEEGEMYVNGEETSHFSVADWENFRSSNIGFVFQNYNIIDSYTVLQNVMVALEVQGYDPAKIKSRALELIELVGLTSHKNHKASKLSGGQKQRAVIARALAKDAPIIMADEPTGNLDSKSGEQVMKLLHDISKEKLVIVVTHNYEQMAEYATRRIKLSDGRVIEDKTISKAKTKDALQTIEPKKMNFKKIQRFAFRNIFATPKKLFFSVLVQSVMMFLILIVLASQLYEINNLAGGLMMGGDDFSKNKVIVSKIDHSEFTQEEIEQLSHTTGVNFVPQYTSSFGSVYNSSVFAYTYPVFGRVWENGQMVEKNYDVTMPIHASPASIYDEREIIGRLPQNKNEIIILDKNMQGFEVGESCDLYLNSFMMPSVVTSQEEIDQADYSLTQKYTFKVVGALYNTSNRSDIAVHDSFFADKNIELFANSQNGGFKLSYQSSYDYNDQLLTQTMVHENRNSLLYIIPTDKLTGREVSFFSNTAYELSGVNYEVTNPVLRIENSGPDLVFEDVVYKNLLETFVLTQDQNINDYYYIDDIEINGTALSREHKIKTTSDSGLMGSSVIAGGYFMGSQERLYVSDELYEEIINSHVSYASSKILIVNDVDSGKKVVAALTSGDSASKYLVLYGPAVEDFGLALNRVMANISLILIMMVIVSLSYAIISWTLRNVLNTRKRDFAVFRSIGANKNTLSYLVVLEQIIVTTICYAIVMGAIIIASILSLTMNRIFLAVTPLIYVSMFLLLLMFSANMGRKFNKKLFKQTVIGTLA